MSGGVLFQSSRGRTKGWGSFRRSWRGHKFYYSPSAPVYREAFNIHACTNVLIRSIAQLRGSVQHGACPVVGSSFRKCLLLGTAEMVGERVRKEKTRERAWEKRKPSTKCGRRTHQQNTRTPLQSPWIRLRIAVLPPAFLRQTSLYTQEAGLLIKIIRRHIRSFEVQN